MPQSFVVVDFGICNQSKIGMDDGLSTMLKPNDGEPLMTENGLVLDKATSRVWATVRKEVGKS